MNSRPLLASGLVLALLAVSSPTIAATLASVRAEGRLVMLCSPHDKSEFIRATGEGYWGLDYEILETFAASIGVDLEVQPVEEFSELIPSLQRGEGDVIASSFSITDERRKVVDFSESYFPVRVVVVAKKGIRVEGPGDLTGKRAAVVPGSSLETFVLDRVAGVRLVHVPVSTDSYEAVRTGAADFALVDTTAALVDLADVSDLESVYTFPDRMGYGFAVPKGSDLAAALSAHVRRLRSSGIFYNMLERFFGPDAVEVVRSAERD